MKRPGNDNRRPSTLTRLGRILIIGVGGVLLATFARSIWYLIEATLW